jgi:hypothetical protein
MALWHLSPDNSPVFSLDTALRELFCQNSMES